MKIAYASDLHTEFSNTLNIPELDTSADVLVLAGDLAASPSGFRALVTELRSRTDMPIITVTGNHEYYMRVFPDALFDYKEVAETFKDVRVLENELVLVNDVRFLGCTLWSDMAHGRHAEASQKQMNDYRLIRSPSGTPITPEDTVAAHKASLSWLSEEFARPFPGKTVLVTHHAPSFRSQNPKYAGSAISGAFCSDMELKVQKWKPALVIHGHLHDKVDYIIGKTRVVANPWGYPGENTPSFQYVDV